MAEETTDSVETGSEQAVPAQAEPAASPAAPDTARKDSPLLTVLTVLLIVVGIVDLGLWGLAGYYFFLG